MRYLIALSVWAVSLPSLAHSLYLFAQTDGKTVSGKSYYSDMSPAAETYVEAYFQGQNEPFVTGKTDSSGHFSLPVSEGEGNIKVVVEGEEGHRVSVVADRLQSQAQATADSNQFTLLREDINQLKHRIYLHDIIGGIGYIVGVLGLLAFWQRKRESR